MLEAWLGQQERAAQTGTTLWSAPAGGVRICCFQDLAPANPGLPPSDPEGFEVGFCLGGARGD